MCIWVRSCGQKCAGDTIVIIPRHYLESELILIESMEQQNLNSESFQATALFLILTLSLPRGGEISPPPTKIESYSFKDVSIFFNFWCFFKLIMLTNPGKVRFFVYYKKNFRNLRTKISSQSLFGLKILKDQDLWSFD